VARGRDLMGCTGDGGEEGPSSLLLPGRLMLSFGRGQATMQRIIIINIEPIDAEVPPSPSI
jgi:hypothetical protein